MTHALYFDGSSRDKGRRGGPGPSAGAAVLSRADGGEESIEVFIRSGDTLIAEYQGLIQGLRLAVAEKVENLLIYGDSRIIIDHMLKRKLLKNPEMELYRTEASELLRNFKEWSLIWIPRRKNARADEVARRCLEKALAGVSACRSGKDSVI